MESAMKSAIQRFISKRKSRGQGMTEYIVIVALIAVAAIAIYQLFGATIRNQTAGMAMEVAGKGTAATKATTAAKDPTKGSLSTFGDQATTGKQ
jgi:Flp pilus assembly pilin Flp